MRLRVLLATLTLLGGQSLSAADDEPAAVHLEAIARRARTDRPALLGLERYDWRDFDLASDAFRVFAPEHDPAPGEAGGDEEPPPGGPADVASWLTEALAGGGLPIRGLAVWPDPDARGRRVRADLDRLARAARETVPVDLHLEAGGQRFERTLAVPLGRWTVFEEVQSRPLLGDYRGELACDNSGGWRPSAVGDPVVVAPLEGWSLALRAFPAGSRLLLEGFLQAGRIEWVERLALGARFLGDLELPRYAGAVAFFGGVAAPGEAVGVSVEVSAEGAGGFRLALTPRAATAGTAAGEGAIACASGSLLQRRLLRPVPATVEFQGDEVHSFRLVEESEGGWGRVEDALAGLGPYDTLVDVHGGVWLAGPAAAREEAARRLAAASARRARAVVLAWRLRADGQDLARGQIAARVGGGAAVRWGREHAFVLHSDAVIG